MHLINIHSKYNQKLAKSNVGFACSTKIIRITWCLSHLQFSFSIIKDKMQLAFYVVVWYGWYFISSSDLVKLSKIHSVIDLILKISHVGQICRCLSLMFWIFHLVNQYLIFCKFSVNRIRCVMAQNGICNFLFLPINVLAVFVNVLTISVLACNTFSQVCWSYEWLQQLSDWLQRTMQKSNSAPAWNQWVALNSH